MRLILIAYFFTLTACGDSIETEPDAGAPSADALIDNDALPIKVPHDAGPCRPDVNRYCPDAQ